MKKWIFESLEITNIIKEKSLNKNAKLTQLFLLSTFFLAEKSATPRIPKTIGRNKNIPLMIVVVIYFFLFKII